MADLARQFRSEQIRLRAGTLRDLLTIWPILQWSDLDGSFPAWLLAAAPVITRDRARAVDLAGAYLTAVFGAARLIGAPRIVTAPALSGEQLVTSMRVTTVIAAKRSAVAGKSPASAMQDAFVQSSGAASRLALDGGRDTVVRSVRSDSRARGWRRVTSGHACDFCAGLAGGRISSDEVFPSHDHCSCVPEPVYDGG